MEVPFAQTRQLLAVSLADKPEIGPGGPVVDVLLMLLPVTFLVVTTVSKRLALPTSRSVPMAAAALFLLKLSYLGAASALVVANVLQGLLLGLVPLSILFGAFVFYNILNVTQCTAFLSQVVARVCCGHPVAEVMLIVWGLGHLVEGASGFGTPGALLPPIAAGLGHDPFHSVVALLIATTTVGPFGSSGIGIWFGLSALNWPRKELVRSSFLVALTMAVMSYPIGLMSARFLLSWQDLRGCWLFVLLSITAGAVPALAAALFSFEIPALLSGVTSVLVTGTLALFRVGLSDAVPAMVSRQSKLAEGLQQRQQSQQVEIQIELPAAATAATAASGRAYKDDSRPVPPPYLDRRPSSRTLRSRTVSSEAGSGGTAASADTAVQLLSALHSPRRRRTSSQQQQQQEQPQPGRGSTSGGGSRRSTSAAGETLLPATRSLSAPSFSDMLCKQQGGPLQVEMQAVAWGTTAAGIHPPPASGGGRSQGLMAGSRPGTELPVNRLSVGKAEAAAKPLDTSKNRARLVPWLLMLAVVAGTRVPYLQKSNGHELTIPLRSLCDIRISSNLVVTVADIFETGITWSYALCYVPSLLPFVGVGLLTLLLFRKELPSTTHWSEPFAKSWAKCKGVMPALLSALVLVALMVGGDRGAPAFIIGYWLSTWLGGAYIGASMLLGAVGAFFSGSVATSNLTFAKLQQVAAARLGMPGPPMLMLQIVGGAAGQMISIANILGARAVMNLQHIPERHFIKAALPAAAMYYCVGTLLSLPFLLA